MRNRIATLALILVLGVQAAAMAQVNSYNSETTTSPKIASAAEGLMKELVKQAVYTVGSKLLEKVSGQSVDDYSSTTTDDGNSQSTTDQDSTSTNDSSQSSEQLVPVS